MQSLWHRVTCTLCGVRQSVDTVTGSRGVLFNTVDILATRTAARRAINPSQTYKPKFRLARHVTIRNLAHAFWHREKS